MGTDKSAERIADGCRRDLGVDEVDEVGGGASAAALAGKVNERRRRLLSSITSSEDDVGHSTDARQEDPAIWCVHGQELFGKAQEFARLTLSGAVVGEGMIGLRDDAGQREYVYGAWQSYGELVR